MTLIIKLSYGLSLVLSWAFHGVAVANGPLAAPNNQPLFLLQPLDDATFALPAQSGIDMLFTYFNISWPYIIGTVAGIAVLQGVVAGVQIMYGGSPDKVEAGKTRFLWALGGMIILGLAGTILRILNPIFFT
jgi:hypothetical protein